ncbi:hypothetical protein AMJ44_11580 [candidate division WOR-1 bacterium DG_54_3]|uniref:Uncharacterized protein n=1 Tax=candidate division WOR-1 bacterium DG_54_3 TaxID=1703775 RepID=A0A0S7XR89_UNCSA|nr:MAG: hypothetical protein AMJ44_11580 [candidate division WOR-1 bacterium DG_54_3]
MNSLGAFLLFWGLVIAGALLYKHIKLSLSRRKENEVKVSPNNRRGPRPDREISLWERERPAKELESVREYVVSELLKLHVTDWGQYALKAICDNSPDLSKLMIGDSLDIEFIKTSEKNGINDAVEAVKKIDINGIKTLRQYFHKIFENIYKSTSYAGGSKFYWYGRDRVIGTLRTYRASRKKFTPSTVKFYDVDGEELNLDTRIDTKTMKRIQGLLKPAEKLAEIQKLQKQHRFKIQTEYPFIEFDLGAIEKAKVLKFNGSLTNECYLDLKNTLSLLKDTEYDGYMANTNPLYDVEISCFSHGEGSVMLWKYRGAVEYYPDRLFVEFRDIDPDSWLIRWLKSYKLHLEGND